MGGLVLVEPHPRLPPLTNAAVPVHPSGRRRRILVVSGDSVLGELLAHVLTRAGFEVAFAADGGEALGRIEGPDRPHVVILEIASPGAAGLEVCRRLRSADRRVPILILSARNEVDDRVAGLAAGADDCLDRSFSPHELLARLRALLRRSAITSGPATLDV